MAPIATPTASGRDRRVVNDVSTASRRRSPRGQQRRSMRSRASAGLRLLRRGRPSRTLQYAIPRDASTWRNDTRRARSSIAPQHGRLRPSPRPTRPARSAGSGAAADRNPAHTAARRGGAGFSGERRRRRQRRAAPTRPTELGKTRSVAAAHGLILDSLHYASRIRRRCSAPRRWRQYARLLSDLRPRDIVGQTSSGCTAARFSYYLIVGAARATECRGVHDAYRLQPVDRHLRMLESRRRPRC